MDSNRLIQRNKNLLNDILEKQGTEKRRTQYFLKYSLRKREEKSDEEIKSIMKNSTYDPKADPLMPRLFRKFDSSKSTILSTDGHLAWTRSQRRAASDANTGLEIANQ